jgi:general stress protein YciG
MASDESNASGRGFGAMDPEKRREAASKGGHAAQEKGTAHEFNKEEAKNAGQKGGESAGNKKNNSRSKKGREDWGGYQGY